MHLESLLAQKVKVHGLDLEMRFSLGETIHTENSYKFTDQRGDGVAEPGRLPRAAAMDRRQQMVHRLPRRRQSNYSQGCNVEVDGLQPRPSIYKVRRL